MRLPRWMREGLRPLASRVRVPILSGVNRGRWWNLASAGSGYATGRRSLDQMEVLASLLQEADRVWDVGAHHGFMTLMAARRVGPSGHVWAFEPSALNVRMLRRHLRWNGVENAETRRIALGDFDGESTFGGTGTTKMLALGGGDERVEVVRGDTLIRAGVCAVPTVMKIDVEGAEGSVLRGMGDCLPATARLLVAIHSREALAECRAVLADLGFTVLPSRALTACTTAAWRGDPDLLALGPGCAALKESAAVRRYLAAP